LCHFSSHDSEPHHKIFPQAEHSGKNTRGI
jgi:hypothetical protein